jgi:hypothetical protein
MATPSLTDAVAGGACVGRLDEVERGGVHNIIMIWLEGDDP